MSKHEFDALAMPAPDRDLIEEFLRVMQEWAPTSLKSIILYGSITKGIFPEGYDLDFALIFSSDFDHRQYYSDVYQKIKTLKPHREMHVVLKWEGEIEPAYRELLAEGIVVYP